MKIEYEEQILWKVLESRDRRQRLREDLLVRYRCPLVQVSPLNPGPVKNSTYALRLQELADEAVRTALQEAGLHILQELGAREETGPWDLYVVKGDAAQIKRLMIQLEEMHPLGRLFDLDVIDTKGIPLSRRLLGYPERRCILCGGSVSACIRMGSHTLEELLSEIRGRIESYTDEKAAVRSPIHVARLCREALREEVELTPKPGLVDLEDPGAHTDMCLDTFYQSIDAIVPYFEETVRAGWNTCRIPVGEVLPRVRHIGVEAEQAMFTATAGVNTHKGVIFSMGILCLAIGRMLGLGIPPKPSRLFRVAKGMCRGILRKELEQDPVAPTKGWEAFKRYGVLGVRGEAEKGFPRVRFFALPLLRLLLFLFPSQRDRCLLTVLLGLMVMVQDTNILGRGGREGLRWVRLFALRTLLRGGALTRRGRRLLYSFRAQCKARRLSPGGSADLLALTIFLDSLPSGQRNRFHG
jgi:holo-ACP synthase/triphosphoribosyl-dephospho-CoA synthase